MKRETEWMICDFLCVTDHEGVTISVVSTSTFRGFGLEPSSFVELLADC